NGQQLAAVSVLRERAAGRQEPASRRRRDHIGGLHGGEERATANTSGPREGDGRGKTEDRVLSGCAFAFDGEGRQSPNRWCCGELCLGPWRARVRGGGGSNAHRLRRTERGTRHTGACALSSRRDAIRGPRVDPRAAAALLHQRFSVHKRHYAQWETASTQ